MRTRPPEEPQPSLPSIATLPTQRRRSVSSRRAVICRRGARDLQDVRCGARHSRRRLRHLRRRAAVGAGHRTGLDDPRGAPSRWNDDRDRRAGARAPRGQRRAGSGDRAAVEAARHRRRKPALGSHRLPRRLRRRENPRSRARQGDCRESPAHVRSLGRVESTARRGARVRQRRQRGICRSPGRRDPLVVGARRAAPRRDACAGRRPLPRERCRAFHGTRRQGRASLERHGLREPRPGALSRSCGAFRTTSRCRRRLSHDSSPRSTRSSTTGSTGTSRTQSAPMGVRSCTGLPSATRPGCGATTTT